MDFHRYTLPEEIRKFLENGFKPFMIELSNGRRFEVPRPDFIAISSRTIVVSDKDELGVHINPLHVVSVKEMPTQIA